MNTRKNVKRTKELLKSAGYDAAAADCNASNYIDYIGWLAAQMRRKVKRTNIKTMVECSDVMAYRMFESLDKLHNDLKNGNAE